MHYHLIRKKSNSLDRRAEKRVKHDAEIMTFWNDTRFQSVPVIDCTEHGARIIASEALETDDKIGVVVQYQGRRIRTFARVAWASPLEGQKTVVGLEFLKLDFEMAA